ncbi:hypothetical protein [Roseicyclus elongatus]|nr:hypothetical protein [Roseibacterium elongatum]
MANTDSFIDEVSEELRRDRLYALFRRWAWLAVLIVAVLVGGAAWLEWQRAQDQARAEAFGNALLAALDGTTPEARIAALGAVEAPGPEGALLVGLLAAGEAVAADPEAARETADTLRRAAAAPDVPPIYRDLAIYKAHLLSPQSPAEARLELGGLAEPGRPFAALAEEQLALLDIAEGDIEAGIDRLRALENAAAATPGLQQRAAQLIVALETGARLVDTAPEAAPELPQETAPEAEAAPGQADPAEGAPTQGADEAADEEATAPEN